ncbi:MAG: ATP-dependent DNA helicase RecG [Clostridia bacterium]|nr:ATP-dependent DNA helicase RecG [Clostridia bacterium]
MELKDLSGIGPAREKSFNENGIFSPYDLINYYPYKYYDFSKTEPYSDDGKARIIKSTVIDNPSIVHVRGKMSFITCKMADEVGHKFNAVWFNQTYLKSTLYLGAELFLFGKNSKTKKNTFNVNLSKFIEKLNGENFLPVYHSIEKIGQKIIHDAINESLEMLEIPTFVPNKLLSKYNLMNIRDAYKIIHNPTQNDDEILSRCKSRIELESLIPILAINDYNKMMLRETRKSSYTKIFGLLEEFEKLIPFKLTYDQIKACHDIENDFLSKFSMNRLLQGDVGSGKTMVALFGAFIALKNGFQSAIIAPTEILASQHFNTAQKIFNNLGFSIVCLTGSQSAQQKNEILSKIERGEANLIIGTHALLSQNINFKNLSFAVIDEQHRFGVEERKMLKNKGITTDILVMSATPIPRSLSLVFYGDLDISKLLSRPHRVNIQTNIVIKSKQNDMWNYIQKKIEQNSKVFVVCAKIDEENDDDSEIALSAKNMYTFLCKKFDKTQVGLIHGKLSKENQNKVIESFKNGSIKILVSTTIIEVGVDIEGSDILVIASPERFGLATLHQLRGRIGRDGKESNCFCLADNLNEKSFARIAYFKDHTDGFDIAEFDLKTRGAGSVLGTNQHGDDNGLIMRLMSENYSLAREILEQIKKDVPLFTKVLEKGAKISNSHSLSKIILN